MGSTGGLESQLSEATPGRRIAEVPSKPDLSADLLKPGVGQG